MYKIDLKINVKIYLKNFNISLKLVVRIIFQINYINLKKVLIYVYNNYFKLYYRCREWVVALRREDLLGRDIFYRNYQVCSDHFEAASYSNPNDRDTSRLSCIAKPTLFNIPNPPPVITPKRQRPLDRSLLTSTKCQKIKQQKMSVPFHEITNELPVFEISSRELSDNEVTLPGICEEVSIVPPNSSPKPPTDCHDCPYKAKYKNAMKKILQLHARISRMRKKPVQASVPRITHSQNKISGKFNPILENFISMQHQYHDKKKRGMRWTNDDKQLAMSIFYKSPSTYQYLKTIFALPCNGVLYNQIQYNMAISGLCHRTLKGMSYKVDQMTQIEKVCCLSVDGMKIRPSLQYLSNDRIVGFEEKEDGLRTSNLASEMVVLMVQGIGSPWKQVNK